MSRVLHQVSRPLNGQELLHGQLWAKRILCEAKDFEADLVLPAVEGTLNILTTALKFSVIKKVVITSSILAQVSLETVLGPGDATMYNQDSITPDVYGPFDFEGAAYCASKSRALNATAEFIRKEKPTFDVINILPGMPALTNTVCLRLISAMLAYVLGRNELAQDVPSFLSGTNLIAMALVLGKSTEDAMVSAVVTLQDVAKAHIFTLKPNVKGNRNFAATTSVVSQSITQSGVRLTYRKDLERCSGGCEKKIPGSSRGWQTASERSHSH